MSQHEATQQEKYKAQSEEHKLQVEQLKAGALREQNQAELERRKHQHEMDMKKVQYQGKKIGYCSKSITVSDQLAQKRKEKEMQLELQKQKMAEEQRLASLEKEESIRRRKLSPLALY